MSDTNKSQEHKWALKFQSLSQLLQAVTDSLPDHRIHYSARDEEGINRYYTLEPAKTANTKADTNSDRKELIKGEEQIEAAVFSNQPVLQPAKTLLVPETECYLQFNRQGKSMDFTPLGSEEEFHPQLILGLKGCDLKSFSLLDQVFLDEPEDPRYKARRENTYTIATRCRTKSPYCMCDEFSADRLNPHHEGADLILENDFTLKADTDRGGKILTQLENQGWGETVASDSDKAEKLDLDEQEQGIEPREDALSPNEIMEHMDELFESSIWDELAMRCLNCGVCTYYCPTCHCFDIQDFYRKNQGVRYRRWDSCMFSHFTLMAGGHNPRMDKSDRVRNRFFHKLNFFPRVHGEFACVGCGRCIKHCPVGITIKTALKRIGGAKVDSHK